MPRERLQKILAAAGVASRRRAEELIRAGRVTVAGVPARLGASADPERDLIAVDGERLQQEPLEYWLLHKPPGVLSTAHDPRGRPTVLDLLPPGGGRVYPVGRLDLDSEGLLLLTNDGALTHALLHPSQGHEREYRLRVAGRLSAAARRALLEGVALRDGPAAARRITRLRYAPTRDHSTCHLVIAEGRKRQVRRMLEAVGHRVLRLVRVRMGPLELGSLAPGQARPCSAAERRALLRLAGAGSGRAAPDAGPRPGTRSGPRRSSSGSRKDPSSD